MLDFPQMNLYFCTRPFQSPPIEKSTNTDMQYAKEKEGRTKQIFKMPNLSTD